MNTSTLSLPRRPGRARVGGFSLIELMIGLVIGMIAVFVMMQVFQVSEGYKRTAGGGADAQTSGTIALDYLQRDIQQSGYGLYALDSLRMLGCSVLLPNGVTLTGLGPITINHPLIPRPANTDTLLVVHGSNASLPAGDWVNSPTSNTSLQVSAGTAFTVNDQVVFAPGDNEPNPTLPCAIGGLRLQPVTSVAGNFVGVTQPVNIVPGEGGLLINLGQTNTLKMLAYAVRNGTLTVCDLMLNDCTDANNATLSNPAIWAPVENNVVSLRAIYGRDTTLPLMNGTVDVYDQTVPATGCQWLRATSVRLALVTQSAQFEKGNVTTAAPNWPGDATAPLTLSGIVDWQRYRYRVFQTVIPLRNNALIGGSTTTNSAAAALEHC